MFKLLASVASTAIKNLLNEGQSVPILRNSIRQRVELAFIVRYQASKSDAVVTDVASFLDLYHLLSSADFEFLRAISASGNTDIAAGGACYRHLLRAILLSLDNFATDHSFKVAPVCHIQQQWRCWQKVARTAQSWVSTRTHRVSLLEMTSGHLVNYL